MLKVADLREKTPVELRTELRLVQRALIGLRAELTNQASENTAGLRNLRREIAQIKTVLRSKLAAKQVATTSTS